MLDIYFEPQYGKLYEKIENGKCENFKYTNEYGTVYHIFIKREIETKITNQKWYDLVTPYGYGGPIITNCKEGKEEELAQEFMEAFSTYCKNENIVSEFIRFHPIIENVNDFKNQYKVDYQRDTVGTTISLDKDPMMDEFSKSARKTIRRAIKSGLDYRITRKPDNIEGFKEVYYSTMDRNRASDYYYFKDDYFRECLANFGQNILFVEVLYEDKVVASAFYFVYNDIIHAHLSGTLKEYIYLSPAYIIKYATANWAKENRIKTIHYGGGTTNNSDDPLYNFKKKFTKNSFYQFYTGKKIWDREMYKKLCLEKEIDQDTEFFPAYRQEK